MRIIIIFTFVSLFGSFSPVQAYDIVDTHSKNPSIEERLEDLEQFNLEQRTRNSELEEKIEMLAEKNGYSWRRQINRGIWIKK